MTRYITLHYKGNTVYYNTDHIVTVSEGTIEESKGFSVVECANDRDNNAHLVDEAPDIIMAMIRGDADKLTEQHESEGKA